MNEVNEISRILREHDKLSNELAVIKKKMEDVSISLGMNREYAKNHIASSGFLRGWIVAARNNS
jgi:hypothetical protein